MSVGKMVVTARPETRSAYQDFIVKDSVSVTVSTPASLVVSASAFGVQTGFLSDVLITAVLKNQNNRNVSTGTQVRFEDVYANGTSVGGRFRLVQNSSDENSKVSAYYSPGNIAPGTDIYIRVSVLNSTISPQSVLLTVTP
jgi:hypothetical protein